MFPSRLLVVLVCILGVASLAHAMPSQSEAAAESSGHTMVPTQRWHANPALRTGMSRIRASLLLLLLSHGAGSRLDDAGIREQVKRIDDAVAYLVTHCDLAPDADAVLHGMLGPLLTATRALKERPRGQAAMFALRAAVADYPRYFDDPGWAGLELRDVP